MVWKKAGSRLANLIRKPSPNRNSILTAIEDAEQQRRWTLTTSSMESQRATGASPKTSQLEPEWSAPEDGYIDVHELASRFGWAKSCAVNQTIGLITLGRRSLGREFVENFGKELAAVTERDCFCIMVSDHLPISSATVTGRRDVSQSFQVLVDSWGLCDNAPSALADRLADCVQHLPRWKAKFPLILIDLSIVGQPWTEQVGRLCDAVYAVIPGLGALSPSQSISSVSKLIRAGVRIQGSWTAAA